jgi:CRP/FNR family transcriptional regulator, cyclic AMP receptor protein
MTASPPDSGSILDGESAVTAVSYKRTIDVRESDGERGMDDPPMADTDLVGSRATSRRNHDARAKRAPARFSGGRPNASGLLNAEELNALASRGTIKTFRKQTVIISEGDENDSFYIILSGRVKCFVSDDRGKEIVLATQGPSEYFGETMLDDGPRAASVMTLESSRIVAVPKSQFIDFLLDHPLVALKMMRKFASRVRSLIQQVRSLALMDVHGRVARLLTDLAVVRGGALVVDRMSQHEIASRVGASREMISRVLKELCAGGYITIDKTHITILKRPRRGC